MSSDNGSLTAVLVGINGYHDGRILKHAVEDACCLQDLLRRTWRDHAPRLHLVTWPAPDHAVRLEGGSTQTSARPTPELITSMLRDASAGLNQDDTFVVYFAGHGRLDHDGAEPQLMLPVESREEYSGETISVRELLSTVGDIAAKCLLVLDCCLEYDGDRPEDAQAGVDRLRRDRPGWTIWFAASPGEQAMEDAESALYPSSALTAAIVAAIKDPNLGRTTGSVPLLTLAAAVGQQVAMDANERNLVQHADGGARDGLPAAQIKQNPLLVGPPLAVAGPKAFTFAPAASPSRRSIRRAVPPPSTPTVAFRAFTGRWPLGLPGLPRLLVAGGLLYAALMSATSMLFAASPTLLPAIAVGAASFVLWRVLVALSVASNEEYWHGGGWIPVLTFLCWTVAVVTPGTAGTATPSALVLKLIDVTLVTAACGIFGANVMHNVLILAELARDDARGDFYHLMQTFRAYRVAPFDVDIDNIVSVVSARPDLVQKWIGLAVVLLTGEAILVQHVLGSQSMALLVVRDVFILSFAAVMTSWYRRGFASYRTMVYPVA